MVINVGTHLVDYLLGFGLLPQEGSSKANEVDHSRASSEVALETQHNAHAVVELRQVQRVVDFAQGAVRQIDRLNGPLVLKDAEINDFFVFVDLHLGWGCPICATCDTDRLDFHFRVELDFYDKLGP